jgi:hypothetical protein
MKESIDKKMQVKKPGQMENGGRSCGYMYEEGSETGGREKEEETLITRD